ncbi:ABC transporter ATP-binding protein [Thermodesulfobacteriota bacterium]
MLLEVVGLKKYFGGLKAVDDVSFNVNRGEIVSLIGPNGAGKTTLFNCLTGVIKPSGGEVYFHGANYDDRSDADSAERLSIKGYRPDRVAKVGISRTFQNIRLFSDLSVIDNVKIGRHIRTKTHFLGAVFLTKPYVELEKSIEKDSMHALKFVGIPHKAGQLATNLPYGEQKLLEIARALAVEPLLLLLDEPAAGMNPFETNQLMRLIKKIKDTGVTVLLIEHDMRLVMNISDRIVVLNYGRKIAEGTPGEIKEDKEVVEAYLGGDLDPSNSKAPLPLEGSSGKTSIEEPQREESDDA